MKGRRKEGEGGRDEGKGTDGIRRIHSIFHAFSLLRLASIGL